MNGEYIQVEINKAFFDDFGMEKILSMYGKIIAERPNFLISRSRTDRWKYILIFTDQPQFTIKITTHTRGIEKLMKETVELNEHATFVAGFPGFEGDDFPKNNQSCAITFQFK